MDEKQPIDPSGDCSVHNQSAEDAALLEKYNKIFIGEYSHSLDSKGRIIVPLAFREGLGDTFYIGPSFNFESIALYPNLVWAKLRDGYAKISRFDSGLKRYLEQFDALCYRGQECDSQGRILLSKPLLAHARLEKPALIIGAGRRAEIWNPEVYEQTMADMTDEKTEEAFIQYGF